MKKVYIDAEGNGIVPTIIWCIVTKDMDTGEVTTYSLNGEYGHRDLKLFNEDYKDFSNIKFYGHNIISWDAVYLEKILGYKGFSPDKDRDSVVMSRLFNFERGSHSLESWGQFLGDAKLEHNDWSKLSPEMIERCVQDVHLGHKVVNYLVEKEAEGFNLDALLLEQNTAWACQIIETNGFALDVPKATKLLNDMVSIRDSLTFKLSQNFPKLPSLHREVKYQTNKEGVPYVRVTKPLEEQAKYLEGDYSFLFWETFNPGSRQQIVRHLMRLGWEPKKFTEPSKTHPKGQPQIDEEVLESIKDTYPIAKELLTYFTLAKRIPEVEKWLSLVQADGRVHGRIFHIGARTHRASHSGPNFAQVPAVRKNPANGEILWGLEGGFNAECRQVWTVPKGYKLVGVDAAAIQLVILAHNMGDTEYIKAISTGDKKLGTDIHTINRNKLRNILKSLEPSKDFTYVDRDVAKTHIYMTLLGGGDAKTGQVLSVPTKQGSRVREEFLNATPALKELLYRLEGDVARYGKVFGIDGRSWACENSHFSLSYVLQGTEAIIMKKALVAITKEFIKLGLDARVVAWVHDEFQIEAREDIAEQVRQISEQAIVKAAEELNLKCPLGTEARTGYSWLECH